MTAKLALLGLKHWKEVLIGVILVFLAIFIMFFGGDQQKEDFEYSGDSVAAVSPMVLSYESVIAKYAKEYGVSSYVQLLMAKMMQESGGRGGDPMQSSESIGLPPNAINDPEKSIDVGVKYFSGLIKKTKGDIKLTLQSYNFGGGFIDYALKRGGYSKAVAVAFSEYMSKKMGWEGYGDVNYVDNVLKYLNGAIPGEAGPVNSFGFVKPAAGSITSDFGYRLDPFTGVPDLHAGIDFGCNGKPIPIFASKSGSVGRTGWENPGNHKQGYGQRIYLEHGSQETVYGHLSKILVTPGQKVSQGQVIAACGNTGSSTGYHLHFELHISGEKVDPAPYVR